MAQLKRKIKPLSTLDMLNAMKSMNGQRKYYFDVMSFDRLLENKFPQNNFAIVFNTLPSYNTNVGHWCLLFNDEYSKKFYYLDSLNDDIDNHVKHLIELRLKRDESLISNSVCLQKSYSTICGYICLYVLKWLVKGISLREILEFKLDMDNFDQIENEVIQDYFAL